MGATEDDQRAMANQSAKAMNILVVHLGYPGQFKHLLRRLRQRGDQIWVLTPKPAPAALDPAVHWNTYRWKRLNSPTVHPLAQDLETKVTRGEALAEQAEQLRKKGFQPDLILGHPGWGEMLFLHHIWPSTPQLHYVEFFFDVPGTDTDFADVYAPAQTWQHRAKLSSRNAALLPGLETMAAGITPTRFQHSLLPTWAQFKTTVIHEGVNTHWLAPDPKAALKLSNGLTLQAGDPIVTFVNRTFEPYRGVHVFLQALALAQQRHPHLQALLVGKNTPDVSYGKRREDGRGWLDVLREEMGVGLDWSRIHVLGTVPHTQLRTVYQVSAAHVYFTYPFVLSWSLLEAMSCGCLVIGSDTPPVRELVEHDSNGWLVPFQDSEQLAERMLAAISPSASAELSRLRREARQCIRQQYDVEHCSDRQLLWLDQWEAHTFTM